MILFLFLLCLAHVHACLLSISKAFMSDGKFISVSCLHIYTNLCCLCIYTHFLFLPTSYFSDAKFQISSPLGSLMAVLCLRIAQVPTRPPWLFTCHFSSCCLKLPATYRLNNCCFQSEFDFFDSVQQSGFLNGSVNNYLEDETMDNVWKTILTAFIILRSMLSN